MMLETKNLSKHFYKNKKKFLAVHDVSIRISSGECVGLVGESGCGKSTLARMVCGLGRPRSGEIQVDEQTMCWKKKEDYQKIQMVFQTPMDSFDPRQKLGFSIGETMRNFGVKKAEAKQEVLLLLGKVGLGPGYYDRYPREVSGGECQRAGIARAISIHPPFLICDEVTSSLDVSVQAQIVELLRALQQDTGYLFISHDLALVRSICDRIYVMLAGYIVEEGTMEDIMHCAKHPYTKQLLNSVLPVSPDIDWEVPQIPEDNGHRNAGCPYYNRCPRRAKKCENNLPELNGDSSHKAACFYPLLSIIERNIDDSNWQPNCESRRKSAGLLSGGGH